MNVDAAKAAHETLVKSGVNFVACLPDSAFQELYLPLSADPKITYVQVASENDGVGVCMGAWLGGMKPALLVENTGFTLGTYALLRGPMAFGVPMLLLISHRGSWATNAGFRCRSVGAPSRCSTACASRIDPRKKPKMFPALLAARSSR